MKDIDKSRQLYAMIAERCEKGGFSDEQAKIYREMIDFMADCETMEQATEKFKGSPYYLAAGAALMVDKFSAYRRAAEENGMPEVAQVYEKRVAEIRAGQQAMYIAGCEQTAQNAKVPYLRTLESFGKLYNAYVLLSGAACNDDVAIDSYLKEMNAAKAGLEKPSADPAELVKIPVFKSMLHTNDEGCRAFVEAVKSPEQLAANARAHKGEIEAEGKAEWEKVKAHKSEIMQAGAGHAAGTKRSLVTAVSPTDRNGKYSFIDEEVR